MMRIIRADAAEGALRLGEALAQALAAGKRVLWLVSGGSNIPLAVQVMRQISGEYTPGLSITLMDERYGPAGHPDSNFRQLQDAGFAPKQATLLPILDGSPLQATTDAYARRIQQLLADSEVVIGQFGIGADGHTAGILPHSPAAAETQKLAVSYQGQDFTRVTLTFPALRRVTAGYAFVYGPAKRAALEQLRDGSLPLEAQPAQILRAIPETYVYNDQVETEGGAA